MLGKFNQKNQPFGIDALEPRIHLNSYYVSPSGSDNHGGTRNAPWLTLQHAANNAEAGDTITVRAGSYSGFVVGWDSPTSGTAKLPITFKADIGAIITKRNSKTNDGIDLESADYVVLQGFTIKPAGNEVWRAGIRSALSQNMIIRNNTLQMRPDDRYGIFSSFTTDLLVESNVVTGTLNSGIYTSNSAVRPIVRGNEVHNAGGNGLHFNGDISQGGNGIISEALVEQNIIYDTGQSTGGSAINMDGAQRSHIENNVLYDNHAKGITLYKIDAAEGSTDNQVLHNTVVMPSDAEGYALTIKNGSTSNSIYNNILLSESDTIGAINISDDSISDLNIDNNIVTGRYSTTDGVTSIGLSDWKDFSSGDAHTVEAKPEDIFRNSKNNDFHLTAENPAIDAANAANSVGNDVSARSRPGGAQNDIGAFEYVDPATQPVDSPTELKAQALTATSVALTWNDLAWNENGYLIRAKAGAHGQWFSVARRPPNSHSYTIGNLTAGQKYYFAVRAFNANGNSMYTNVATTTLASATFPE